MTNPYEQYDPDVPSDEEWTGTEELFRSMKDRKVKPDDLRVHEVREKYKPYLTRE